MYTSNYLEGILYHKEIRYRAKYISIREQNEKQLWNNTPEANLATPASQQSAKQLTTYIEHQKHTWTWTTAKYNTTQFDHLCHYGWVDWQYDVAIAPAARLWWPCCLLQLLRLPGRSGWQGRKSLGIRWLICLIIYCYRMVNVLCSRHVHWFVHRRG